MINNAREKTESVFQPLPRKILQRAHIIKRQTKNMQSKIHRKNEDTDQNRTVTSRD